MIEPIKPIKPIKLTIANGVSKAITTFEENGVTVKFIQPTTEFTKKVTNIIDTFMYNNEIEKTSKGLQQLTCDVFERSNNAIK